MVKADLSRDYYGDLELAPNADVTEIKKQFKKLALTYHPDRNPGRENEVTAKFQRIQSAHEVLIDPTERAKYDANRIRASSSSFRSSHTGTGGQASGVRGNPWANAGAGWAPPPKPPTARNRAQPPPPPSSGARRYDKFTPPQASAYQAAQEGPQAREAQFKAWENTRHPRGGEHGPGKTWTAPKPPPRGTPQSGREESNAQSHAAPPKTRPGFDEYRDPSSSHSRSQSTNPPPSRKGFMPNMSGGDEPPAPRGNYSTQRDKPSVAPEPPPRQPPQPTQRTATGRTDPLKKFRDPDPAPTTEPRVSTPYATHGGEKFNPFESAFPSAASINRSKSTRERGEVDKDTFPAFRAGSDTNLSSKNNSPQRARSFAARSAHAPRPSYSESVNLDSSSDEEILMNKSTARASARRSNGATPRTTKQATGSTTDPETKPTNGPPLRSGQPTPKANGEPSIFSFNLGDETFAQTAPKTNGFSNSAENISTKFTSKDWDGKFEAGASYFQPEKAPSTPQRPRSQSNSRSRGRSPIKVQPMFGQPTMPSRSEQQTPIESPGGTKFSAEHWDQSFKPQTFMPPPMPQRTGPGTRKKSIRTTMGGNAAVVDDSETSDEKPLFTERKKSASPSNPSPVASPEPMDVDTPPIRNTVPQFTNGTNVNGNTEPLKRPAASASPVDTELKVAFDDLKVKDIISTLDMPVPPLTPTPPVTEKDVPTRAAYDDYLQRYEKYMAAWDLFNKKFLMHMVARKNQNDVLQGMRWTDDQGLQIYRDGLKADQVVMQKWAEHMSVHEAAVKCFVIMKERMQSTEAAEARRPRKKTH